LRDLVLKVALRFFASPARLRESSRGGALALFCKRRDARVTVLRQSRHHEKWNPT